MTEIQNSKPETFPWTFGKNMYQDRTYRNIIKSPKLIPYKVVVKETDLMVYTETKLIDETRELVLEQRGYVEAFIKLHLDFARALIPWQLDGPAPGIIENMVKAARPAAGRLLSPFGQQHVMPAEA